MVDYFDLTEKEVVTDEEFQSVLAQVGENWTVVFSKVDGGWRHILTEVKPPPRVHADAILITDQWAKSAFQNCKTLDECKRSIYERVNAGADELDASVEGMCKKIISGKPVKITSAVSQVQEAAFIAYMQYRLGADKDKLIIQKSTK